MALTLEHILTFMKTDKAERAKEREEDKREMKDIINNMVKNELEATINPIMEKQQLMEKEQEALKNEFSNILQEIKEIQEQLLTGQHFPPLPNTSSLAPSGTPRFSSLAKMVDKNMYRTSNVEERQMKQLASEARKIIGFNRIDKTDVERAGRLAGAVDEDEAYLASVKEYLRLEMKLSESVYNTLTILQVFPPAKEEWDTLYVRFESEADVDTIYTYASNLTRNQRLVRYIPKQFYERYRAMESEAYNLRQSEEKFKTRVKMGMANLILYKKRPSERNWTVVPDSLSWPSVNLIVETRQMEQTPCSPPPGRPARSAPATNSVNSNLSASFNGKKTNK